MSDFTITLEDGKYTYVRKQGQQFVLRYGEPWRNEVGNKFLYCLAARVEELQETWAAGAHVVMSNDYPEAVFSEAVTAERYAVAARIKAQKEWLQGGNTKFGPRYAGSGDRWIRVVSLPVNPEDPK